MSEVQIKAERDVSIFGDVVGRDKITINLPPPLPPAEAKDRANLLILLRKVKTFWIEGVLEKSVHNAVLLELGKETKPEAVEHPWEMVLELPDQTNQVLPSGTKIIEIFEKMNRAMLILGEPGSGKTITLLELARDLISRAETDPTQPIPVVFNLSSWTDKSQPLHDWLVFELSTKYQIPKRISRAWLKKSRILPLLDGLNEMKPENRMACVEAINYFGEKFGLPGHVVCSRLQEYSVLSVRLKLNGAICLQPLTSMQVNSYLEAGGSKLANLHSTLQKDEALQELAQSPLMLSIMSLAYQDVPVETMTSHKHDKIEDQSKNLFNVYIASMFKRKGKANQPYATEQTIGWLSWLAKNMCQHNQSIFLIEQLQPSWLSTRGQCWVYTLSSRLIGWLNWKLLFIITPLFFILPLSSKDLTMTTTEVWGLILALLGGMSAGLVDGLRFERHSELTKLKKHLAFWLTGIYVLISWVSGQLYLWLIFVLRARKRNATNDIQTVETVSWSWVEARTGGIRGVKWGLSLLLILLLLIVPLIRTLLDLELFFFLAELILGFLLWWLIWRLTLRLIFLLRDRRKSVPSNIRTEVTLNPSLTDARKRGVLMLILTLLLGQVLGLHSTVGYSFGFPIFEFLAGSIFGLLLWFLRIFLLWLIYLLRDRKQSLINNIQIVETRNWSWIDALKANVWWLILIWLVGQILGQLVVLLMWGSIIDKLIRGFLAGSILGVFLWLFWKLTLRLIIVIRVKRQSSTSDIQTVETLNWLWTNARKEIFQWLILIWLLGETVGLLLSLVSACLDGFEGMQVAKEMLMRKINSVTWSVITQLFYLALGLVVALGGGLIGAIFGGLKQGIVDTKTLPNQGIKLSIKNSIIGGLIIGLMTGVFVGLIAELIRVPIAELFGVMITGLNVGLRAVLFLGLLAALWYGGLDVIQHYTLRVLLCWKKYTPRNYTRFLDYASSLIFLQKVGGGYIFIHRLLLEHFAAMPLQGKSQSKK
jgi:hypothetical protein